MIVSKDGMAGRFTSSRNGRYVHSNVLMVWKGSNTCLGLLTERVTGGGLCAD